MLIEIKLLGAFEVQAGDFSLLQISGNRLRALLAVLAIAPGNRRPRELLATLLWGDRDDRNARHSLSQALTTLRKMLGPFGPVLQTDRHSIGLDSSSIAVDAQAVLEWRKTDPLPAVNLGRGSFLEDVDVDCDAFQEWLLATRYDLRERVLAILGAVLREHVASGRQDEVVAAGRQVLSISPLDEEVHAIVMRAYLAMNRPDLAALQFRRCRETLKRDLDVNPSEAIVSLGREATHRSDHSPSDMGEPDRDLKLTAEPVSSRRPWDMRTPAVPDRPSIAVLPFEAADGADFFAEGMTEDIIVALSRFRSLFVTARASSFIFRWNDAPTDIGRALGVRYLLRGSVRRASGTLRVFSELVEAATLRQIWAECYNRPAGNVFAVLSELGATIVSTLVGRVEAEEASKARRKPTNSLVAYELVLRGKFLMNRRQTGDEVEARGLFAEAVAADPDYALARVQLAIIHLRQFFWVDSRDDLKAARRLAKEALTLDDAEPWAHAVLALCHLHDRVFDAAVLHGEKAAMLNPNDAGLVAKWGLILTDVGRPREGIAMIERAMRLDPLHAETYCDYLGLALFTDRRYEAALQAFSVAPNPQFFDHVWMAACHAHMGRIEEARSQAQRVVELAADFTLARFAAREPISNPNDLEHWLIGLRIAGLS